MARGYSNIIQAATIFVDGENLMGIAASVTLPNIQARMQQHRPMGLPSEVKRFTGYEPPVLEFVLDSYEPAALKQVGNPDVRAYNYQVRWSTQDSTGTVKYGVVEAAGVISGAERDAFEDGEDPAQTTFTVECVAYKETFDNEEIYDLDTENAKWKVGGVNHWEAINQGVQ